VVREESIRGSSAGRIEIVGKTSESQVEFCILKLKVSFLVVEFCILKLKSKVFFLLLLLSNFAS
jgi:hypothetical protein